MKALVGYTGFVGSNLLLSEKFDNFYNSKNIQDAYNTNPDLLVYAGMKAEKYLANNAPEEDMQLVIQAEENIIKINPKKLVIISTIDVFKNPKGVNENTRIDTNSLQPYGYNRYQLECWVRDHYPNALIVRLPGLFGVNIKKNFIYDYIYAIPFMIKADKMEELVKKESNLLKYYENLLNGFYKVKTLKESDKVELKGYCDAVGFNALNFTDSRNVYQFYPLSYLWKDIQTAFQHNIKLLHTATEPIATEELYFYLSGKKFHNEVSNTPVSYDYRTIYDKVFRGENGYLYSKEMILKEIKRFVVSQL